MQRKQRITPVDAWPWLVGSTGRPVTTYGLQMVSIRYSDGSVKHRRVL